MAKEVPPRKIIDFHFINLVPKPIYKLEFKTLPFYQSVEKITKSPVGIYCFPPVQSPLAQLKGYTQFELQFPLTKMKVREMKENLANTQLQIRFGEELEGMSELSEGLPGLVQISINSHEKTATSSPINFKCSDSLYLEDVDIDNNKKNLVKICWPLCEKPFYMMIYIVESKTVDDLVKHVECHNRVASMTLNTKALCMNVMKDFKKNIDAVFVAIKFTLLCPITLLRMKIPARSFKCVHSPCFDLHTFFSLNKIKPTWKCPFCYIPIVVDELVVDSFILDVVNDPSLPENCNEILLYDNGNWGPYIVPKKEIIEDGESKTGNVRSKLKTYTATFDGFKDYNPDDFKKLLTIHSTDYSDTFTKIN